MVGIECDDAAFQECLEGDRGRDSRAYDNILGQHPPDIIRK